MHREDPEDLVQPVPFDGPAPMESAGSLRTDTLVGGVFILLALTVIQRMVGFRAGDPLLPLARRRAVGAMGHGLRLPHARRPAWRCCRCRALSAATSSVTGSKGNCAVSCGGRPSSAPVGHPGRGWSSAWPGTWFSHLIFGCGDQTRLVALSGRHAAGGDRLQLPDEPVHLAAQHAVGVGHGTGRQRDLRRAWDRPDVPVAAATPRASSSPMAPPACSPRWGRLWWLRRACRLLPETPAPLPQRELWSRLLPFTAWIMMINLLTSLFDLADRQMIIHCSTGNALAEVGNYRSSRVVPLLLASVTAMIAAVATPHLSCDWEAGRRGRVSAQMNLLLKVLAAALTAGAVLVLAAAPLLFQVAFRGKYAGGLAVMPWTLIYCTWFGLTIVAQKYLWCAERAGWWAWPWPLGLAVNVALNLLLLAAAGTARRRAGHRRRQFRRPDARDGHQPAAGHARRFRHLGRPVAAGRRVPRPLERHAGPAGRGPLSSPFPTGCCRARKNTCSGRRHRATTWRSFAAICRRRTVIEGIAT